MKVNLELTYIDDKSFTPICQLIFKNAECSAEMYEDILSMGLQNKLPAHCKIIPQNI